MANEFNAKGRRMVFEEDIEKIGQGGGSEYTAGNGIDITNNEISVDDTVVQGKLTAGSGISIDNDVISATGGSGASFTDWVNFGDSERYTVTAEEYNQLKNGEKRLRYRGAIYEVCHINLEPDWSGFTGLILEISAPGVSKIDTYGQDAKVGKYHININGPDMQDPYVVSYNQDPLVAANTGDTPDYTLTTLKVGDNVYSVGGGSAEIDEQTIIEDSVTGKLKTAVGGWKEVQEINLDPSTLDGTGVDWDVVDQTLCESYLATLEVGVHYPITLEFTGTTVPSPGIKSAEIYVSNNEISGGFGSMNSMLITDNDDQVHAWKFSVKENGYNIHVWPADSWVSPAAGSTITITIDTITKEIVHTIDSKYIPDVTNKIELGFGLKRFEGKLELKTYGDGTPIQVRGYDNAIQWILEYNKESFYTNKTYPWTFNSYLDSGYNIKFEIDKNAIQSQPTSADIYTYNTNQADFINAIQNSIMYTIKENLSNYITPNNQFSINIDNFAITNDSTTDYESMSGYAIVSADGKTITVDQSAFAYSALRTPYFTYDYESQEVITSATKIEFTTDIYNFIMSTNLTQYLKAPEELGAIAFNMPKVISNKFLPAFNEVPKVAGTYTLQATVDAQGNVTYAWVAVQP